MKVDMKTSDITKDIIAEIARIPEMTEKAEKKVMKDIAKIIVEKVKRNLPKSDIFDKTNRSNFDGSKPYVHMIDDVKSTVKQEKGLASVVVGGGKLTAFKWHLVNDGAHDRNGNLKTQATHFVDKAMAQAEQEIDALIDKVIEEVANGG